MGKTPKAVCEDKKWLKHERCSKTKLLFLLSVTSAAWGGSFSLQSGLLATNVQSRSKNLRGFGCIKISIKMFIKPRRF
jgi:hypothetical protein